MEALANWFWQGSVIAIVATAALRAPRVLGATARYRLWWTAMAIVLALPVVPMIGTSFTPAPETGLVPTVASPEPAVADPLRLTMPAVPTWAAFLMVSAWMTWTMVFAARIGAAFVALRRARRHARAFPRDREARLDNWMALRPRGRAAVLVLSDEVRFAAVLGGRTPAIAISPAVAEALDDRDLDRIVVHEWAHVQRRDDGARVAQLAVQAIAGWHPAVWWLDRQIDIDRETACDDWAVNLTGSAKSYAASLTRLASVETTNRTHFLLPAIFSSELTRRIVRLLDASRTTSTQQFGPAATAVLVALLASAFTVASSPVISIAVRTASVAPARATQTADTVSVGDIVKPIPFSKGAVSPAAPSVAREPQRRTVSASAIKAAGAQRATPLVREPALEQPLTTSAFAPPAIVLAEHVVPGPDVHTASDVPGTATVHPEHLTASPAPRADAAESRTPWGAAADAGVNVGRGSQKAAVATAGFFSRLGKSIARSF